MITSMAKDPYTLAEQLGVPIIYRKLAGGLQAYWDGTRIIMDTRLTRVQECCALAHDLMHVLAGDEPYLHAMGSAAVEARRDAQAAEFLIDPGAFAWAVALYPDDPAKAAAELGVTDRILNAYARAHPPTPDALELEDQMAGESEVA